MYIPQGGGRAGNSQCERADPPTDETVGTVEHCSCGLLGLLATAAIVVAIYPMLVALTQPLFVLSSTAIVFVLFAIWLVTWLLLELAWEWRAGRLELEAPPD